MRPADLTAAHAAIRDAVRALGLDGPEYDEAAADLWALARGKRRRAEMLEAAALATPSVSD